MGVQENEDESVNLLEVQHEVTEEEPIEQVFSQEAEDISTVEQSIESEDQERFEETARFEDIAAPQVEPKPQLKKANFKITDRAQKTFRCSKENRFGDHKHSKRN